MAAARSSSLGSSTRCSHSPSSQPDSAQIMTAPHRPRTLAVALVLLLSLLANAAAATPPPAAALSADVLSTVRLHLVQKGHITASTPAVTAEAYVRTYVELLQAYLSSSSAELCGKVGRHPEELSGRYAQHLADVLDEAWCQRTGACTSAPAGGAGRGLLDIADALKGSPPKEYAAILAWAAAASLVGNDEGSSQVTKYSDVDAKWANCIIDSIGAKLTYRPAPNVTTSYVYPLRAANSTSDATSTTVKIAILGDWGTGQPQELDMLDRIAKEHAPDIVLHLGDVYYSGTEDEQDEHIYKPVRQYLGPGIQFYTIPGNHDYYAGGQGFLNTIDKLRKDGVTRQQGSFWALEGAQWVILGLDTARTDNNPRDVDTAMPYLEANQLQWALHKLKKAKAANKRIILASHHQLFTAHSTVGQINGTWPAVNVRLYTQLAAYMRSVAVWFWGHEHSIQAFAPYVGLRRGRLLGNSGVPVLQASNPYEPNGDLTVPKGETGLPTSYPGSPRSSEASFGYYLQHSFAILTLTGRVASIEYYQQDWDCFIRKDCEWSDPTLMWREKF